jgi:hypothetical protein
VSAQDWCTVCTKHTIGSEIVLDALGGTPRLRGSSGSSIQSKYRCTVRTKHTIGSEIILDAPGGTPR